MATFDPQRWDALMTGGDACPLCGQNASPDGDLTGVVATLRSGRVLLQDDGDFPGYCVLVHRRHATELFELAPEERGAFVDDVARIARVIAGVCSPAKINYAVLGNEVPHLHCHVIPRYPGDGWWGAPIWNRPASSRTALTQPEFDGLLARLREALASGGD